MVSLVQSIIIKMVYRGNYKFFVDPRKPCFPRGKDRMKSLNRWFILRGDRCIKFMKETIRLMCTGNRWFTVPKAIYYSLWAKKFFVECNKCGTFHQVEQLMSRTCGHCRYFAPNTSYKTFGGKPILPNQCLFSGGRLTTSPPRIVDAVSKCVIQRNVWKPTRTIKEGSQ